MHLKLAGAILVGFGALCGASGASAETASGKPIRIWNLTASVVTDFRLAKAGGKDFGRNLTLEDDDKTIEVDERLKLPKLEPGVYDARLTLKDGRSCRLEALKIDAGAIVGIEEKDLRDCAK
ncbi:hypothetical protein CCR94_22435 [Rhodoblastus sphagnicola]|uniref:Uncharacterized protein n=1 Tax=Rhodoblastus sphagnicola TaxID=333368 RepID=A0A2S6MVN3_9HYPH|nr:hypothetical protein [Rhodoblastus sphagnicola]MBB4198393.1 hypothetical protein [Rhodoblastus sphagnicola]PPQ26398.1 hypothetical protein CCR94_22435 [Rhodoblastus sphagnicola]